MTDTPNPATLYSNGRTPLFLDLAKITFDFHGAPSIIARLRLADINYESAMATAVFSETDTTLISMFGSSISVPLAQLEFICRASSCPADLQELGVQTLKALPRPRGAAANPDEIDLRAGALIAERRHLARAEEAIDDYAFYSHRETFSHDCAVNPEGHSQSRLAGLAEKARHTALNRLSRLSDAQALSVIEGNRIGDLDRSTFPFASIGEVQKRRAHLCKMQGYHAAGERILNKARAARRPDARMSQHNRLRLQPKGT